MRAGFIGLGDQGAPMARRIVEAGFPLTIWARRPASVEPFADTAATTVSSPAEVGRASDVVGICVFGDADVDDVVLRPDGVLAGMAPGGVIVVHSTVRPDTCRRLAGIAAEGGVAVLDAPVSGGGAVAAEGGLLVMVGGDEDVLARCRAVLETYAATIVHLGPVGTGQAAKLVNNLVLTAQLAVAFDTYAVADRLGIERAAMAEVLAAGSGGSVAAEIVGRMPPESRMGQGPSVLRKDVDIALEVLAAGGHPPPEVLGDLAERALGSFETPPQ